MLDYIEQFIVCYGEMLTGNEVALLIDDLESIKNLLE